MTGFTFDTGALIALERKAQRITTIVRSARRRGVNITVPAIVVAEWWRGRTDLREAILAAVTVEAMDAELAQLLGETIAAVRGTSLADAMVMVSAAQRGDMVLTSDIDDLERLRKRFPDVRLLRV